MFIIYIYLYIYVIVKNEKVLVHTSYVYQAQSAVMRNKCTADCARFLVVNETRIDASVSRAQSALILYKSTFYLKS